MNLVCQQCKKSLQLDASLVDLSPSAYDMVAASLPPVPTSNARQASEAEKLAQLPSPASVKAAWQQSTQGRAASPCTLSPRAQWKQPQSVPALPNESFVLLQDSVIRNIPEPLPSHAKRASYTKPRGGNHSATVPVSVQEPANQPNPSPLSHHLRSTLRLFNLLSSRTDVDHPLCSECTHNLLSNLNRQLEETKKERDGYIAFEKEVRKEKEREGDGMSKEEAEMKIGKLKEEESLAVEKLQAAEREREQLNEELKALELEEKALEEEEAEFWRIHNTHLLKLDEQASQLAALRAAYSADSSTLEKLERTNVYNDAFCVGHEGVFGTINGLRLGRVPGVPVEWAEINAAWGQTLLLLYTIARKLDYTFENYRLIPMGSFSRIERTTGDKSAYELYGSGDLHLGRLLHNRRFDFAMVAFLDCLKQLVDLVKSQDPQTDFPHQIVKDKIGEASVKLQFNQEEAWTRALRHVLLALKILLKWTTSGSNG
ncbi:Vacuolar protein sorting-associated protein [Sparassis crispa]|uniref:Vacuolar protein sorting-associated protein n=1 Tax=Sparassis crispa TaxID=139825 RepID=A0A401GG85_9APHY|nr:Vacuolar protein sorting-associated protein [Sparassis crispa]GBE81135.1 Vacuolar protein sorting-associated protein [Sparassis crispa]